MTTTLRAVRAAALSVLFFSLYSCALPLEQPIQTAPVGSVQAASEPDLSPDEGAIGQTDDVPIPKPVAAAERLQAQAASAYEAGDFSRALALLERAQRMAPRDGSIYLDMATAHRAGGRTNLACQFARKGLSVPVTGEVADALEAQLDPC